MIIGVPKEITKGEKKVSLIPDHIEALVKNGHSVIVEKNAGENARYIDSTYTNKGAQLEQDIQALVNKSEILVKVRTPIFNDQLQKHEIDQLKEGSILIGTFYPLSNREFVKRMAEKKITCFSLDLMPRITRAQSMDVLSSMSSIAGYKCVIIAANLLGKLFPMQMTAAGTIQPAKVFVIGAGVAGLQAIATARRLGAVVEGYDIRPAVKQEVESLGAKFVSVPLETKDAQDAQGYAKAQSEEFYKKQAELLAEYIKKVDVVITTALVPGKKAPLLLTEEMVKGMKPGSVIVDLAAEQGGNCAITEAGKEVVKHGVIIAGPVDITSSVPVHASQLYSKNITNFLLYIIKDNKIMFDSNDEIIKGTVVTHNGESVNEQVKKVLQQVTI